ncbi:MOSC domain-containing protein [Massilia yuzhufengensis]|uniref:MOSC domain-containing protein n=1 Tax=Massilia yuzhufengensis TaxID=1164594 RepID=A0A1I1QUK4_9BURK|nr:MOSC domain-containing protein [Massilia yuzhufengensis]SFD25824.1 hypothetical protein SAMN05216204_12039 [Massilia yuzhufengensis]
MRGTVVALATRAPASALPLRVPTVQAVAGRGLDGDRHADPHSPRQLLLAGSAAYDDLGLPPLALRENLLVDVDTVGLESGMLLAVGLEAVLRLSFQCEACGALDARHPGLARAIGARRGILARVVQGGAIREGDPVRILDRRMAPMAEDWRERVLQVLDAAPPGMVVDYATLARLAGIQSTYCRAFPRLLASRGYAGRAVPARSASPAPRWAGAGLWD